LEQKKKNMTIHVDLLICKTKITLLINYYTDKLKF